MNRGCDGRLAYLGKLRRLSQHGRRKKYKQDFHKLRRLNRDTRDLKGQSGAIAYRTEHGDRRQRSDSNDCIQPCQTVQKMNLMNKKRYNHRNDNRRYRYLILPYRLVRMQPV